MTEIKPMPDPAASVVPAGSQKGKLLLTMELDQASALLPLVLPKAEWPTGNALPFTSKLNAVGKVEVTFTVVGKNDSTFHTLLAGTVCGALLISKVWEKAKDWD